MTYQILALFLDGGSQVVERETKEGAEKLLSSLLNLTSVTEVVILPQEEKPQAASFTGFGDLGDEGNRV